VVRGNGAKVRRDMRKEKEKRLIHFCDFKFGVICVEGRVILNVIVCSS
jgi:hypothetical protein